MILADAGRQVDAFTFLSALVILAVKEYEVRRLVNPGLRGLMGWHRYQTIYSWAV